MEKRLKRIRIRFTRCGSQKRIYRHLKPGRYTFRVQVIGHASWDPKTVKRRFRIRCRRGTAGAGAGV